MSATRLRPMESEIIRAVESIPRGRVTTYREIAAALGDPRASRAVAEIVRRLGPALGIPWHRVVGRDGRVADRRAAVELSGEGVPVEGGFVPLSDRVIGADELGVIPILSRMRRVQERMAEEISLEDGFSEVDLAAGVDVSYAWVEDGGVPREVARAACVVLNREMRVVDGGTLEGEPPMPYVPTYLGFREVPLLAPLARKFDFDVLIADGHGLAHPRMMGEASHLGLVLGRPTLGAAKRRLVGWVRGDELVYLGRVVGWVLLPPGGKRPIYASPGHLISMESTREVVYSFRGRHRIPEPVRLAHRLSRFGPSGRRSS